MKSGLLKAERVKRGWTQAKVAEVVGVDSKTVGRWERGKALPYPYYRKQLCLLFDKTPQQLGLLPVDEDQLLENVMSLDVLSTRPDISMPASCLIDPSIPYALESATSLVGRDNLLMEIKDHLLTGEDVVLTILDGPSGADKAAIVTALAMDQQVRDHFCDGILWAGLGPSPTILAHLTRWGTLLGIVPSQIENINSREAWGQALQAVIGTRRMLLILDDAWTADDALSLQVGEIACAHVVTTRFSEVASTLDQKASITVVELEEHAALRALGVFPPQFESFSPKTALAISQRPEEPMEDMSRSQSFKHIFLYPLRSLSMILLTILLIATIVLAATRQLYLGRTLSASNQNGTSIAAKANPYPPFKGQLALDDPLNSDNRGYGWEESSSIQSSNHACLFINDAYQVINMLHGGFVPCHAALKASNFTLEVQMQIIMGNCGGLSLRDTTNLAHAYAFDVCRNGSYRLYRFDSFSSGKSLYSGFTSIIAKGLNRSNIIAAVINGNTFDLYINHRHVASVHDNSYSQGLFGVSAHAHTEVAYTHAKMWIL